METVNLSTTPIPSHPPSGQSWPYNGARIGWARADSATARPDKGQAYCSPLETRLLRSMPRPHPRNALNLRYRHV